MILLKKQLEKDNPQRIRDNADIRDNLGRFAPGNKLGETSGGGRPKGVKDKVNKLREALLDYFLKEGPDKIIEAAAKESKRDILSALIKMMPRANEIDDVTEEKKPIVIIDATE